MSFFFLFLLWLLAVASVWCGDGPVIGIITIVLPFLVYFLPFWFFEEPFKNILVRRKLSKNNEKNGYDNIEFSTFYNFKKAKVGDYIYAQEYDYSISDFAVGSRGYYTKIVERKEDEDYEDDDDADGMIFTDECGLEYQTNTYDLEEGEGYMSCPNGSSFYIRHFARIKKRDQKSGLNS